MARADQADPGDERWWLMPSTKDTPLWSKFKALKTGYPDTVMFFRLGDFYEVFCDDAKLVARELQIVLTSRPMGPGIRVSMAGFPHHLADKYMARLVARGYRVGVAEQLTSEGDMAGAQFDWMRDHPLVARPRIPQAGEPSPAREIAAQLRLSL